MIKKIIWPLIHSFEFNPKIKFNQWGWLPQKEIIKLNKSNDSINFDFCKEEFKEGAIMGYKTIQNAWENKVDFTEYDFTVPSLSLALNYLNEKNNIKDNINLEKLQVKILDTRIECGMVKTNSNFLGLWNKKIINQELITGGLGPENFELWDKRPMKEIVRVRYKNNDRIDIWDWERCLTLNDYNWCVTNINQIIL